MLNTHLQTKAPNVPETFPSTFWCPDLVSTRDLGPQGVQAVLHLAELMKSRPTVFQRSLTGKQMVMFFEKPSLRTRITFEAGMVSLGGTAMFVDQSQSRLDAREKLSDIAHNLERWVNVIVLRTFSQETIENMARYTSVPVINALSDVEHPCQALADYFTLQERFGDVRKISLAYVGDGNNVAHSLLLTCACLGSSMRIATPKTHACECADCCRGEKDCKGDGRATRIAHGTSCRGRRRRCGLHRRLGQHGSRARSGKARADLSALPGQSRTDGGSRAACGVHALPARASRRRSHRCGHGLREFRGLRPGGKSSARSEIHSLFIAGWRGAHCP